MWITYLKRSNTCVWTKPVFQVLGSFPGSGAAVRDNPSTFSREKTCHSWNPPLKNQPVEPHAAQSLHRAHLSAVKQGGKIRCKAPSCRMQAFSAGEAGLCLHGCFNVSVSHAAINVGVCCFLFHVKTLSAGSPLCRKRSHEKQIQDFSWVLFYRRNKSK